MVSAVFYWMDTSDLRRNVLLCGIAIIHLGSEFPCYLQLDLQSLKTFRSIGDLTLKILNYFAGLHCYTLQVSSYNLIVQTVQ